MQPWIEQHLVPIHACDASLERANAFESAQQAWEQWPLEHLVDLLNLLRIHPGGRTRFAAIALRLARETLAVFENRRPGDVRAREILDAIEHDPEQPDDTIGEQTDRLPWAARATQLAQECAAARQDAAACAAQAVGTAACARTATTTSAAHDALLQTMRHYELTRQHAARESGLLPPTGDQMKQDYHAAILAVVPHHPLERRTDDDVL